MVSGVTRDIQDPETHLSVFQRAHLVSISEAKNAEERARGPQTRGPERSPRWETDRTIRPFQDFAGISTLDMGFGGEDDGDQYHSIYDDFYWYTHFVDTDFLYGRALAQTAGTTIMRLAGADIFQWTTRRKRKPSRNTKRNLEKLLKDKQDEITERNLELQEGVFTAAADPRKTFVPPPAEAVPPYMNFTPHEKFDRDAEEERGALFQSARGMAGRGFASFDVAVFGNVECRFAADFATILE